MTFRVESVAVDDRIGLGNSEHSRFRVARLQRERETASVFSHSIHVLPRSETDLRDGRDTADLDVTETKIEESVDRLAVLVESGCDSDGVAELLTHSCATTQSSAPRAVETI